jgi:hypothetical protein
MAKEAIVNRLMAAGALSAGLILLGSSALAEGPAPVGGGSAENRKIELKAESAAIDQDWAQETALAAAAYRRTPTLENEFNLASGYQQTGRSALAIPLYQDVVVHGQYVAGQAVYDYRHGPAPRRDRYNLADEAQRRLDQIAGGQ